MNPAKYKGCIVALDGPSGVGKSSVSCKLAKALGGCLLDTGAMYRSVAYLASLKGLEAEDEISEIAENLIFDVDRESFALLVDGKDLGKKLRTPEVSQGASKISQIKRVRDTLTDKQRRLGAQLAQEGAVVVEGRDITTVVFPDVPFKFYVTAGEDERARRRYEQLRTSGEVVTFEEVLADQRERDHRDKSRSLAPLKKSEDAVVVDSGNLDLEGVVLNILAEIDKKIANQ